MYMRDIMAGSEAAQAPNCHSAMPAVLERHDIQGDGRYGAVIAHSGSCGAGACFATAKSASTAARSASAPPREAVGHVLAFYNIRDSGGQF